jgi:hypothetical protein
MPRSGESSRIKLPCFIQVQDLKDLGRLACAFERTPLPVFAAKTEDNIKLFVQVDLFMHRPILYFYNSNILQHYLSYRNTSGLEEVLMTDFPNNPAYVHSPIIALQKIPRIFQRGVKKSQTRPKFLSSEVLDLANLAKICSYKTIYEEPPLPLFAFERKDMWILGVFTRMDDFEESSIFFYIQLPDPPTNDFLRFSGRSITSTGFTNRVDEHGYIFIKIIRLAQEHPLVESG